MIERDNNQNLQHIGKKLRTARQQRELSLRDLAGRADVSPSLLSQIENGKANPSVMTLHNIATALNIPLAYFFPSEDHGPADSLLSTAVSQLTPSEARAEFGINRPDASGLSNGLFQDANDGAEGQAGLDGPMLVRADDRALIELLGGVIWERLTPAAIEGIEFLQIQYDVGATSGAAMSRHRGCEFGYVLEGELRLNLGFDEYTLQAGDSVTFESNVPHRLTNAGPDIMRAIWVVFTCPE